MATLNKQISLEQVYEQLVQRISQVAHFSFAKWLDNIEGDDITVEVILRDVENPEDADDELYDIAAELELETGLSIQVLPVFR